MKKRPDETGDPADVSRLAIAIKTVREQGDLTSRVRSAEKALKGAQGRVERRLAALKPGGSEDKALTAMAIPAQAEIQAYREREEDWKRRLRETQQQVSSGQQERDAAAAALERTVRDGQIVTPEELNDARSRRDALWALVKIKHVGGEPIPEDQAKGFEEELKNLAGAFGPAMSSADQLADWRFDHAEAASRIAEIKRKIGEQETHLAQVQENETMLVEEGEQLKAEWTLMWDTAPFDALSAEAMLEWLDTREEVLEAVEEREEAESTLETACGEQRAAREQVLGELAALGVDVAALENDSLNVVIERSGEEQRHQETVAGKKAQLEKDVQTAADDVARRERQLKKANEALDEWRKKWTAALDELGVAEDTPQEAVGSQIDTIDRMRETAGRIRSLRHDRIDKINRDVVDFEQVVEELVKQLADDLSGRPAEDAVLKLERRLAAAEHIQRPWEKKTEEIEGLTTQIGELEGESRELAASISHLMKAASAGTKEALKDAIERSDRQRSLEHERQQITETLRQDGDGKSLEELEDECEGIIIDEVAAHEASIQT